jgi:diketogulonate reductase-like aldo/keto reductase
MLKHNPFLHSLRCIALKRPLRAQVVLRWAVQVLVLTCLHPQSITFLFSQRGVSLVPKTSSVARLKENISLFDFQLTVSCM